MSNICHKLNCTKSLPPLLCHFRVTFLVVVISHLISRLTHCIASHLDSSNICWCVERTNREVRFLVKNFLTQKLSLTQQSRLFIFLCKPISIIKLINNPKRVLFFFMSCKTCTFSSFSVFHKKKAAKLCSPSEKLKH